jgi:hypothetical protein
MRERNETMIRHTRPNGTNPSRAAFERQMNIVKKTEVDGGLPKRDLPLKESRNPFRGGEDLIAQENKSPDDFE